MKRTKILFLVGTVSNIMDRRKEEKT